MLAEIVFAAGCFWGVEKHFENIPGVVDVKSGYVGGNYDNPDYRQVLTFKKLPLENKYKIVNHTEGVLVKFDKEKINAKELVKSFWELHDPTQVNRQGNDIGNNYRSAIFYTNDYQKEISFNTKKQYQTLLTNAGFGEIATEIKPLEKFWEAEEFHQDYLVKNPNGYCPTHATGVKFNQEKTKDLKVITPLGGKEILVLEAEGFCPYCEKFKEDVSSKYNGDIILRTVYANQLKDFKIKTKFDATPTIVFIEDGIEVASNRGYLSPKEFYEALGKFKLGADSESFNVAFNKGTDARFCKQYDIFKNTPDGVFVDKLSGDILFDTKDRFNSGTGWLSFYKAKEGSVVEKPDYSYGMIRTEVLAKKSGIHLGHVFNHRDKRRFCINATVLDFIPRDKIKEQK
jgi:peptide methionine sulfoxide reductase msrA/msrB